VSQSKGRHAPGWRERAELLEAEVYALYLACRDPRVPWYAKLLVSFVVGYALSPIDLIPDFIPVLGYLDDLIIVPLGVSLVLRMIPRDVMDEHRRKARLLQQEPKSWVAGAVIALLWVVAIAWAGSKIWRLFVSR